MTDTPAETVTAEVATVDDAPADDSDKFEPEPEWEYGSIEFMGDTLNIRKPTQQALTGFSLASSKFVSATTKNDITGLFVARHLSPLSYDQVFSRLMDPDDHNYTVDTVGELMKLIVEASLGEDAAKDHKAK